MALERWLLELAKTGNDINNVTRYLVAQSNNVMITSVVASVAMAYPDKVGETALAMLQARDFFVWDVRRFVHDQSPLSAVLSGFLPKKKIYEEERIESDKLPHRARNLEWLALTLQTGPLRDAVWRIVDNLKKKLPSPKKQSDDDKLWRLTLHRIDFRNFDEQSISPDGRIIFTASEPEADIRAVIAKTEPMLKARNEASSLFMWGLSVLEGRAPEKYDPSRWREVLALARQTFDNLNKLDEEGSFTYGGGLACIAAVCVRDHWSELTKDEQYWCREFIISTVNANKDTRNDMLRVSKTGLTEASRPAAFVLPILMDGADESAHGKVAESIANGLTHAIDEVREYTVLGIRRFLWQRDENLASACVAGLLLLAQIQRRSLARWKRMAWQTQGEFQDFLLPYLPSVRKRILSGEPLPENGLLRLSLSDWSSTEALNQILNMLAEQHSKAIALRLYYLAANALAHLWKDERRNRKREEYGEDRNYEAESEIWRHYARFLIKNSATNALCLWEPIALAIPSHPKEVSEIFRSVILSEDQVQSSESFWAVWRRTAQGLLNVSKREERLMAEHSDLAQLGSMLLLDLIPWKEEAKDWKSLQGHERDIQVLFKEVGTCPEICKSFIRLLDSVGSKLLLPTGLLWLNEQLQEGKAEEMISDRNSLFLLARILSPLVYARTGELRRSPPLRTATLRILDAMVNAGSSAAFRMRDFLISPSSPS
jgi:hypothetical protein